MTTPAQDAPLVFPSVAFRPLRLLAICAALTAVAVGLAAVAGGIAEALVTTAIGLLVAIPAVMMFNYLTGRVEAFDVEMDNSSSELIDYFLKKRGDVRR